jgi:hypothetical protein
MMNNDVLLGKFISTQINQNNIGTCLDPKDIAEFIDNVLNLTRQDQVMGHLASCPKCYEMYRDTVEILEELTEPEHKTAPTPLSVTKILNRKAMNVAFAIGLAAAAMIVLMINPFHEITPYESINRRIASVVNNIDSPITYLALVEADSGYGFSSGHSDAKQAFRYGVASVELETALKNRDKENSVRLLKAIIAIVPSLNQEQTQGYEAMLDAIETNQDFAQALKLKQPIPFHGKPTDSYIQFGQWTEAGRIAAITKQTDYFHDMDIQYFLSHFLINNQPIGVRKSLDKIQLIVKADTINDNGLAELQAEFNKIIFLLL